MSVSLLPFTFVTSAEPSLAWIKRFTNWFHEHLLSTFSVKKSVEGIYNGEIVVDDDLNESTRHRKIRGRGGSEASDTAAADGRAQSTCFAPNDVVRMGSRWVETKTAVQADDNDSISVQESFNAIPHLIDSIYFREISSVRDLVAIAVGCCRGLGMECRLVCALFPINFDRKSKSERPSKRRRKSTEPSSYESCASKNAGRQVDVVQLHLPWIIYTLVHSCIYIYKYIYSLVHTYIRIDFHTFRADSIPTTLRNTNGTRCLCVPNKRLQPCISRNLASQLCKAIKEKHLSYSVWCALVSPPFPP